MVTLADRAPRSHPDFLTEVLLYALSIADLTMLLALGFVLARNVLKLLVERRRRLPFSRFRAKLVGALLGLTHHPGAAGADRRRRADPQQHADAGSASRSTRSSARPSRSPSDYYRQREDLVVRARGTRARAVAGDDPRRDVEASAACCRPGLRRRACLVEVYAGPAGHRSASPRRLRVAALDERAHPSDALAAGVAKGSADRMRSAAAVTAASCARAARSSSIERPAPTGVVVASDLPDRRARVGTPRIVEAYEDYTAARPAPARSKASTCRSSSD